MPELVVTTTPPSAPQNLGQIEEALPLRSMAPVVSKEGESYKVNPQFVSQVQTYADMADLSYHLVKGRNELSTQGLERFMTEGWKITAFGGFSGNAKFDKTQYDAKNRDLAGFVASHSKTGEAVVVFHGSQDAYDWKTTLTAKWSMLKIWALNLREKLPVASPLDIVCQNRHLRYSR